MAEHMETLVEEALQSLTNIAQLGGYMKRETKEEIQNAVSVLKNYFTVQKKAVATKNEELIISMEVKETQTETVPEKNDSYAAEQVATSSVGKQKSTSGNQNNLPPTGKTANDQNPEPHRALEHRITERINKQMRATIEDITHNIKNMIKEEVAATKQQNPCPLPGEVKSIEKQDTQGERYNATANRRKGSNRPREESREKGSYTTWVQEQQPYAGDTQQHKEQKVTPDGEDEEQWTTVTHRRCRRPARQQPATTGTGPEDEDIQAEVKRAWLHVGRLKQETTTEAVKRFLTKKGITEDVICEEMETRYSTKAFKIGIPFHYLERTKTTDFWPAGVTVRRFRFFRGDTGASLE